MQLTSSSFQHGAEIPSHYTSDGEDASPELSWKDAPSSTQSFVLIVHDPDAPRPGGFTHWVVYNIPPETGHIDENVPDTERVTGLGMQGKNDGGKIGYMGPAPPSGTHRYFFRLYALDTVLDLGVRATHKQLSDALTGHILAQAELMGTYANKRERAA
jgi:Raf kinase inhibitor-like YbhB/YbcL family protein